jgi:hypothetical protein
MVIGGTVQVKVTRSGIPDPMTLEAKITVTNRDFAFKAVLATKKPNGFTTPAGTTLMVPSPPRPNENLGESGLDVTFSFTADAVKDNGPNHGFKYVLSVSNSSGNVPTGFYYVISPDLETTSSEFYRAQCGNYSSQTNTGFISGADLLANVIRHESGSGQSHYNNYKVAQDDPANNIAVVGEKQVGPPTKDLPTFIREVNSLLNNRKDAILAAFGVEPCGTHDARLDGSCAFGGCINFLDSLGNYYPCQATPPPCQP